MMPNVLLSLGMAPKARDLTGQQFTRLTVLRRVDDPRPNPRWLCRCVCGNETIAISGNLLSGRHKSCGCWRGGPTANKRVETTMADGYVLAWDPQHPRANRRSGRVREHILVMEKILGRYLLPFEEVHHKNGVRSDNRPRNLELWTRSQPAGGRVADKVAWAIELLKTYAPENLTTR
jgi:hypothetical protein